MSDFSVVATATETNALLFETRIIVTSGEALHRMAGKLEAKGSKTLNELVLVLVERQRNKGSQSDRAKFSNINSGDSLAPRVLV